jgi:hypothetical protein
MRPPRRYSSSDLLIAAHLALGDRQRDLDRDQGVLWWKIEYQVDGGNDTTTWQVDIQGNPVHLLVP